MSALAALDYECFEPEASPSILRYEPSVEIGIGRSPAPGRAIFKERVLGKGLDLLMSLENSEGMNRAITPAVIGRFFLALPSGLPSVDPYVSAHGSVCFDWDDVPSNALSLFVQSDRRIGYSAYFDGVRTHGTAAFRDAILPEPVIGLVHTWIHNNLR